ncbi:MAG TPA: ABC transporter permease, partial [Aggregatilineales bacterium]|nr:ABC transporter permease [Aggregatilineales bacterium]
PLSQNPIMPKSSTTIITPPHGWQALNFAEVWQYRDLLRVWVKSQIAARYKQSVLGVLWAVINPLVNMIIYSTVFSVIARFPVGDVPYALFIFCGIVPWTFFQACAIGGMNSLTANSSIIKKVYFPRLILPFGAALMSLFDFVFYFFILILFIVLHSLFTPQPFIFAESLIATTSLSAPAPFVIHLTWGVFLFPFFMLQAIVAGVGLGLIFGALDAQFRDAGRVLVVLVNVWFWLTPIIYSTAQFNLLDGWVNRLNPMSLVIEGFRWAF